MLEIVIATAFILVVLWVVSISVRVTGDVSRTQETPDHTVRLQVLNGCGVSGLAAATADKLADYRDSDLEIIVVETDNFDTREVAGSMVISREEDTKVAKLLASKVGVNPAEVVYKELGQNYRQVTVTLVLGQDWEKLDLPPQSGKEN